MRTVHALSLTALLLLLSCATTQEPIEASATIIEEPNTPAPPPKPATPPTRSEEIVDTLHGEQVKDPFRWLENEKAPEVQEWMKVQDAFARQQLQALAGRDVLEKQLKALLYTDTVQLPILRGDRVFYLRKPADKEKAIAYWRPLAGGEDKVLLDPNRWSKDGTMSMASTIYPTWDGQYVAFLQKPNAADEATLRVAHTESGGWLKNDVIEGAKYASPAWLPDNAGFFYEYVPSGPNISVADRPGKTEIRFHKLGSDPKTDPVIYPATNDPTFLPGVSISRDGKYLFVYKERVGGRENTVDFARLDASGKPSKFRTLIAGKEARYSVDVFKDVFYIQTTEGTGQGRIFKTPASKPERRAWKEIVKENKDAAIVATTLVGGQLAVHYLRAAVSELRLFDLNGKALRTVQLPGPGDASWVSGTPESDQAFFTFSTFTSPQQAYQVDLKTGATSVFAKVSLPIDPAAYEVSQVRYPSKDGTSVSMFVVHKKGLKKDGQNPTLLYGYGGFSIPMQPSFSPKLFPWLDAGGVFAVANLRGGNEYGDAWHRAGMLHVKQNTFDDFIAAGEFLVKEGYTQPSKLGIRGGSNGGLLVGAAMTQRPELFGAVVCQVPLLDMVRYHLFGSGKTWMPEYGNPDVAADFQALYAYSPYHHVKMGQKYPALLMMAADHDDRVDPMHARKFVAAVQTANPENEAWLRIEENAGHGGADQVNKTVAENVDMWAFLAHKLGLSLGGATPTVAADASLAQ